jgi:hypothetical protein
MNDVHQGRVKQSCCALTRLSGIDVVSLVKLCNHFLDRRLTIRCRDSSIAILAYDFSDLSPRTTTVCSFGRL